MSVLNLMALLIWGYLNVLLITINHLMSILGQDSLRMLFNLTDFIWCFFNWSLLMMYVHVLVTPMANYVSLN